MIPKCPKATLIAQNQLMYAQNRLPQTKNRLPEDQNVLRKGQNESYLLKFNLQTQKLDSQGPKINPTMHKNLLLQAQNQSQEE